jgi:hypothetical protein
MKAHGGVDLYIHVLLTSPLGGEWSSSRPCRFNACERPSCYHWIGGRVGPRTGLDDVDKIHFFTLPGIELRPVGCPARSQSLYRLDYPGSCYLYGFNTINYHSTRSDVSFSVLFGQCTFSNETCQNCAPRTCLICGWRVECILQEILGVHKQEFGFLMNSTYCRLPRLL